MPEGDKSTIVTRAPMVAEIAARHTDEAETARRLSPQVVRALRDAGFARHFVPVAHGGEAGGFTELTSAVGLVGVGCTSAAWAASLAAYGGRNARPAGQRPRAVRQGGARGRRLAAER
jgi:alkylation response protein AidB-like acyl-CoA dehydrogenase